MFVRPDKAKPIAAGRDNGDAALSAGAGFRRLSVANFGGGDASRQLETKGSKDLPKEGPSQTTNQTHCALVKAAKKKTTCLTDGTATVAYCVAMTLPAKLLSAPPREVAFARGGCICAPEGPLEPA